MYMYKCGADCIHFSHHNYVAQQDFSHKIGTTKSRSKTTTFSISITCFQQRRRLYWRYTVFWSWKVRFLYIYIYINSHKKKLSSFTLLYFPGQNVRFFCFSQKGLSEWPLWSVCSTLTTNPDKNHVVFPLSDPELYKVASGSSDCMIVE